MPDYVVMCTTKEMGVKKNLEDIPTCVSCFSFPFHQTLFTFTSHCCLSLPSKSLIGPNNIIFRTQT